ncbi:MAG: glutamate 5-kinase [Clostridia bacterium]|nr:glutamate 5-kinase [Clostridia bacterium]
MDQLLKEIRDSKRIVIKVGTSTLTHEGGKLNLRRIEALVRVIADFKNQKKEVVLVSSGAIGVGVDKMGLKSRPKTMAGKQAVAAVGQCELMHLYSKLFSEYHYAVGQILLTRDVVEHPRKRENAKNTFETLIKVGAVPVVNENDTVAVEEIECTFGENDTLAAIVAEIVEADLLVNLSDISGLFTADPRKDKDATMIRVVEEITEEIEHLAGGAGTSRGTGGMMSKISAAKIANAAGVTMIITSGENPRVLYDILDGVHVGTVFVRSGRKVEYEEEV